MSAAWPLVRNQLVAHLPALTGWTGVTVVNGQPITAADVGDLVTVGFVRTEDFAGSYEQTYSLGGLLEEVGTIRSEVSCATGADDLPSVQIRAFVLVDAWEAWITSDPTLGVLPQSSSASLAVDVEPLQDSQGTEQRLVVTLNYTARGL